MPRNEWPTDLARTQYLRRLRLMKHALGNLTQQQIAQSLDIDPKRWNNYERGYPVTRAVAWMLRDRHSISIEWLWYGDERTMPKELMQKIHVADGLDDELKRAEAELAAAMEKVRKLKGRKPKKPGRKRGF